MVWASCHDGGDWNWWRAGPPITAPPDRHSLPVAVFKRLNRRIGGDNYREYKSRNEALADMVQAVMQEGQG
jgi:hypothetical protein